MRSVKSLDALAEIRADWERLQWHPNADSEVYRMVLAARPNIERPHIVVLSQHGQTKAMLIGRVERVRLRCTFGYKVVYQPMVRSLTIVRGGLLGEQNPQTAAAFYEALVEALRRGEADLIQVGGVPVESDLAAICAERPNPFFRDHLQTTVPTWTVHLLDDLDAFLKRSSTKRRHELRRIRRQLEKAFPGQVEVKCHREEKDVRRVCADLEKVAAGTYQRQLDSGFIDNPENESHLRLWARRGALRTYILYLVGKPVAFWSGNRYGDVFHLHWTAFISDYSRHEVGTVLFLNMVEDLCTQGIPEIDYGIGDAPYKRRFEAQKHDEAFLYVFAPTLKGLRINLVRTVIDGASKAAKAILARSQLLEKSKGIWRRQLAVKGKSRETK